MRVVAVAVAAALAAEVAAAGAMNHSHTGLGTGSTEMRLAGASYAAVVVAVVVVVACCIYQAHTEDKVDDCRCCTPSRLYGRGHRMASGLCSKSNMQGGAAGVSFLSQVNCTV